MESFGSDSSDREGAIYYDLVFDAQVPGTGQEVNEMCNLGLAVEMSGVQQGAQQTSIKHIRSLMRTLALSAKQAMEALEIPEAEQAQLMEKL